MLTTLLSEALKRHDEASRSISWRRLTSPVDGSPKGYGWQVLDQPDAAQIEYVPPPTSLSLRADPHYRLRDALGPWKTDHGDRVRPEYQSYYNTRDGIIIVLNAERFGSKRSWATVTAAVWKHTTDTETPSSSQNLNYVMHTPIINDGTLDIIDSETGEGEFFPGSREFRLLLGSPNGRGTGALLLQHTDVFGKRTVKSITVWKEKSLAHMYLEIVPWEA